MGFCELSKAFLMEGCGVFIAAELKIFFDAESLRAMNLAIVSCFALLHTVTWLLKNNRIFMYNTGFTD